MAKMTTKLAEVFGLHKKALVGFTDDMAGIRARIVGAKRELAGLEDIRPPDSEITARIDAYIADTLAYATRATRLDIFGYPDYRSHQVDEALNGPLVGVGVRAAALTTAQLLVLANPEGFRKLALAEALKSAKGERQLSKAEIEAERKRLTAAIEDDERQEEAAIRMAESAGQVIERRGDANPVWVLAPDKELGA